MENDASSTESGFFNPYRNISYFLYIQSPLSSPNVPSYILPPRKREKYETPMKRFPFYNNQYQLSVISSHPLSMQQLTDRQSKQTDRPIYGRLALWQGPYNIHCSSHPDSPNVFSTHIKKICDPQTSFRANPDHAKCRSKLTQPDSCPDLFPSLNDF